MQGPTREIQTQTYSQGDTDSDGDVDDSDFGALLSGYTGPQTPVSIPEPTSLALLAAGTLLVRRR